jgi:uncharacterized protein YifE (UPF0438 family)
MKTSKLPTDHQAFLRQRPFAFRCETDIFPLDELHVLTEQGNWLEALATGAIQPVSPEHERFLKVDREEAEPRTLCERAWARLKGRREFEAQQHAAPPPEQAEDYGIVEWDKEKCWW